MPRSLVKCRRDIPAPENSPFQSFSKVPRANGRGKAGGRGRRSLRNVFAPLAKGNGRFGAKPLLIFRKRDNRLHWPARCSIFVPYDEGEKRVSGSAEATPAHHRRPDRDMRFMKGQGHDGSGSSEPPALTPDSALGKRGDRIFFLSRHPAQPFDKSNFTERKGRKWKEMEGGFEGFGSPGLGACRANPASLKSPDAMGRPMLCLAQASGGEAGERPSTHPFAQGSLFETTPESSLIALLERAPLDWELRKAGNAAATL